MALIHRENARRRPHIYIMRDCHCVWARRETVLGTRGSRAGGEPVGPKEIPRMYKKKKKIRFCLKPRRKPDDREHARFLLLYQECAVDRAKTVYYYYYYYTLPSRARESGSIYRPVALLAIGTTTPIPFFSCVVCEESESPRTRSIGGRAFSLHIAPCYPFIYI